MEEDNSTNKPSLVLNRLSNIYYILVAAFPFGCAIVLSIWALLSPQQKYFQPESFEYKIFCFILIAIFWSIGIILMILNKRNKINKHFLLLVVLIFGFAVRLFVVLTYYDVSQPFSDFARANSAAINGIGNSGDYYAMFPAWAGYVSFLKIIYSIFNENYFTAQIFNVFFSTLTIIAIYLLSLYITKKQSIAVMASFLYAGNITNILFCLELSPVFISLPFMLTAMLLALKTFKCNKLTKSITIALISGICIGFVEYFKSIGIIVLIAFIMLAIYNGFSKNNLWKHISLIVITLLIGFALSKGIVGKYIENDLNVKFNGMEVVHFLAIGLNPDSQGQIHISRDVIVSDSIKEFPDDLNKAKQVALEKIINRFMQKIENNPSAIIKLYLQKVRWALQDDTVPVTWNKSGIEQVSGTTMVSFMYSLSQMNYIFICISSFFGILTIRKLEKRKYGYEFIFLSLFIFGYNTFLVLLSEAQSVYKYMTIPIIIILCAQFVDYILDLSISKIVKKKSDKSSYFDYKNDLSK